MTILMTTHFMEEADRLCDRIAIVHHGRIVVEGTPDELKGQIGAAGVVTLEDVYLHSTGRELEVAA
jgi:ABC-2 type transport system ATP-binding protein